MTDRKFVSLALAAALALPATASPAQRARAPAADPTMPLLPIEYAVKIVCGRNGPPSGISFAVARGNYYTAVNVHNPGPPLDFTHKVTVAGFATAGPMTNFQPFITLRYDQALEFDCRWLRSVLTGSGNPPPAFFTGFLVLQSPRELDVVAVYTASPNPSNEVATLHTERVPPRRVQ